MGSIPRPEIAPVHRRPAESALSARVLGRVARKPRCARCGDTGSVWVVCPDAGAIKLPCACGGHEATKHVGMVDIGLATALAACCGVAYLLL